MTDNLPTRRDIMTRGVPAAFQNAVIAPEFAKSQVDPADISAGIAAAFPVMSIRGKVFRIKFRGEEYPVVVPGTNHPAPNVDVVMIKASQAISKIWYEATFVEGSRDAPDCFSTNGLTPDASSQKKQAQFCATCPQNQWGSKSVNGKALKACQDTKRVAVVPLGDLRNEAFGGPMLLRIPPASLQDLSQYSDLMVQWSQTYFSVGTQITFDIDVAHPQLKFAPIRPLNSAEANIIVELQDHPQVKRMLTEAVEYAKAEDAEKPAQPPGGVPINQPPPPTATEVRTMATQPVASPQAYAQPVVTPLVTGGVIPQDDLTIPVHLRRVEPAVVPGIVTSQPTPEYSYTKDGLYRWKPGMAAWEPVPTATVPPPPPPSPAPLAVATIAQPSPPANGQALTPEQQKIAELEAKLAAANAPKKRKKTPPPSPAPTAETQTVAPPSNVVQHPSAPPASGGFSVAAPQAGQPATAPDASGGAPPADVAARLDGLLHTILPTDKQ